MIPNELIAQAVASAPCKPFTTGKLNHDGYARVRKNGRSVMLHRWVWEQVYGPVPQGWSIDHLCRNRACYELAHLDAVPHAVNVARGQAGKYLADRTHCKHGHEYTPENTRRDRKGARVCRECMNTRARDWYRNNLSQSWGAA